jgi:tetratricopeptide (TPR) repeat protein
MVVITIPEETAERAAEALKTHVPAVRTAEHGEYARAIPLFGKVLEDLPAQVDARSNLAMAYLGSGDTEQAKDLLVEALMLNPTDAWSLPPASQHLLQA